MNYLNAEDSAKWLAENKILLHPTEGVWGIGCNAKSSIAIDRIFDLKKRDKSKKFHARLLNLGCSGLFAINPFETELRSF